MIRTVIVICLLSWAGAASSGQTTRLVHVYFQHTQRELQDQSAGDSSAFPVAVYPVERTVETRFAVRQALHQLLLGPTPAERDSGYTSGFEGLKLIRLTIHQGRAIVHLRGPLKLEGVLSEPRLRRQAERTLFQFRRIQKVVLMINGRRTFNDLR